MAKEALIERQKVLRIQTTGEIHQSVMEFAKSHGISIAQVIYEGLRLIAEKHDLHALASALEAEIMRCHPPRKQSA